MKTQSTILAIVVLLAAGASAAGYSGGDGSTGNPYKIATPEDMNEIGANLADWDKHFIVIADIDLADYTGTQFNIIGNSATKFTSVFDGNDHTISNFTYTTTDTDFIALFGCVRGPNAIIKDLTLIDPNVNAAGSSCFVGPLVGYLSSGTISGCGVEAGSVSGDAWVGGLVGQQVGGTISDCYATGEVSGRNLTGGLVGLNRQGTTISDCYATGKVSGEWHTGGLVGVNMDTILNCYATGEVFGRIYDTGGLVGDNRGVILHSHATGKVIGEVDTGGLAGDNFCFISHCYATGSVEAGDWRHTGGLVGDNVDYEDALPGYVKGTILNCYATGAVSGGSAGGLVGGNRCLSVIKNCYATGKVSGRDYDTGGLIGYDANDIIATACFWDIESTGQSSSDGGEGKTTAQMQTESTFTDDGWDFIEIWNIGENQTYPFLRTCPAGDLNHNGRVDMPDFAIFASHWLEGTGD